MKKPEFIVSDHAVLRYIERHCGFSIDPIRAHIAKMVKGAIGAGAKSLAVDGITFRFAESDKYSGVMVVTTALERGMKSHKSLERHKG